MQRLHETCTLEDISKLIRYNPPSPPSISSSVFSRASHAPTGQRCGVRMEQLDLSATPANALITLHQGTSMCDPHAGRCSPCKQCANSVHGYINVTGKPASQHSWPRAYAAKLIRPVVLLSCPVVEPCCKAKHTQTAKQCGTQPCALGPVRDVPPQLVDVRVQVCPRHAKRPTSTSYPWRRCTRGA